MFNFSNLSQSNISSSLFLQFYVMKIDCQNLNSHDSENARVAFHVNPENYAQTTQKHLLHVNVLWTKKCVKISQKPGFQTCACLFTSCSANLHV